MNLGDRFLQIIERLLARESVGVDAPKEMSAAFEIIAHRLFYKLPEREGCYFDGVLFETSQRRTSRKVEFTGEMWVGRGKEQWKERFAATVIDKRITKQDIWIQVRIGSHVGETELRLVFEGAAGQAAHE